MSISKGQWCVLLSSQAAVEGEKLSNTSLPHILGSLMITEVSRDRSVRVGCKFTTYYTTCDSNDDQVVTEI